MIAGAAVPVPEGHAACRDDDIQGVHSLESRLLSARPVLRRMTSFRQT